MLLWLPRILYMRYREACCITRHNSQDELDYSSTNEDVIVGGVEVELHLLPHEDEPHEEELHPWFHEGSHDQLDQYGP